MKGGAWIRRQAEVVQRLAGCKNYRAVECKRAERGSLLEQEVR